MVDVSKQFEIISENDRKINQKLNHPDYRNNPDSAAKAISEIKQLLSYNERLVSN